MCDAGAELFWPESNFPSLQLSNNETVVSPESEPDEFQKRGAGGEPKKAPHNSAYMAGAGTELPLWIQLYTLSLKNIC